MEKLKKDRSHGGDKLHAALENVELHAANHKKVPKQIRKLYLSYLEKRAEGLTSYRAMFEVNEEMVNARGCSLGPDSAGRTIFRICI